MSNTTDPTNNPNNNSKKTIQINQDFFKIGKKGNTPITGTRKNKPKQKNIANNTIKQALAKRVQERKQKDLDDIYQRRNNTTATTQSELTKSLSYLNEFVKNKKKKAAPTKHGGNNKTMKMRSEPLVNVDLPDELVTNILPAPMESLIQKKMTQPAQNIVKPDAQSYDNTRPKYTYVTTPPPYSNLKNTTGGKPTYRSWNQTRKQRGGNISSGTNIQNVQNKPKTKTNTISPIVFNTPTTPTIPTPSTNTERENKLASLKSAMKLTNPTPTITNQNTPTIRITKKTITNKYTVGRKIGGRKVSVLIKNLKTRRKIQEAKKEMKKTATSDIKKYLKSHGLLKVGSVAPNNVLREMYESAMLGGDIHNTNGQVALHNFNADDE